MGRMPLRSTTQELVDCTLYVMQFVADAYHLRIAGYISKRAWKMWEREIRKTLSGLVVQREWQRIVAEFSHDGDFVTYVEAVMSGDGSRETHHVVRSASDPAVSLIDVARPGGLQARSSGSVRVQWLGLAEAKSVSADRCVRPPD